VKGLGLILLIGNPQHRRARARGEDSQAASRL
jgi:hypothetical protein